MTQQARTPRKVKFRAKVANFLVKHVRTLAITAIILGAGVAVFAGSLSSARTFGFPLWAAWAFAAMPDALMVYSASKMRERGLNPDSHAARTARLWMRIALGFSVFTNMNAAFLEIVPGTWKYLLIYKAIMTVVYHGVVVVFLWGATEVATRNRRSDRGSAPKPKPVKVSAAAEHVAQARKLKGRNASKPVPAGTLTPTTLIPLPSATVNGDAASGLILARR